MFQIGDLVNYASTGICRIDDIRKETMGGKTREYYVLVRREQEGSRIFVPCQNETLVGRMRRLPTAEELSRLLDSVRDDPSLWDEDDMHRAAAFAVILQNGTEQQLAIMIRTLLAHKSYQTGIGKHLRSADMTALNAARNLLYSEVKMLLGLNETQAEERITADL